jgi:hypothetical protein
MVVSHLPDVLSGAVSTGRPLTGAACRDQLVHGSADRAVGR